MKWAALLTSLLLIACGNSYAGWNPYMTGGGASVDTCTTLVMEETQATNLWQQTGDTTDRQIAAGKFTATASATVCAVTLSVKAVGSPTQTYTAYIYSNADQGNGVGSDDLPDTQIGTESSGWDSTGKTILFEDVKFTGMSASITSGATYWIVLKASAVNASNYIGWQLDTDGVVTHLVRGNAAESWVSEGAYNVVFKIYE